MNFRQTHVMVSILLVPFVFLLSGCDDEPELSAKANDFYHIEVDDAYLPVMVRGNTSSGILLLYIQGGPGYPSIDFATIDYPQWKNTIEKDFAVVYYDQRGFGNKQGIADLKKMTMAQYTKDILYISRFLKTRYKDSKVILFGHSWGGDLSYHYLLNHQSEGAIDALISICGPATHDGDNVALLRWDFRRSYLINVSDVFIDAGTDVDYWNEAKSWAIATNPIATEAEMKQWNKYVAKAEKFTEGEIGVGAYIKVGFFSPYNIFQSLQYELNDEVASALIQDEIKTNIMNDFDQITLPTLMIGSRFDDQAPLEELQYIFDGLGSSQKQFEIFPDAGHNVFLDDPVGFRNVVRDFCLGL